MFKSGLEILNYFASRRVEKNCNRQSRILRGFALSLIHYMDLVFY